MPDPWLTWSVFAVVWAVAIYRWGWSRGNAAPRRAAPTPEILKPKRRRRRL